MTEQLLRILTQPFVPFLSDPDTTEVVVNRPGELGVEARGQWSWHKDKRLTLSNLDGIGILAAHAASQEFSPSHPMCAASLPDGERIQVCREPATLPGVISITIRKPPVHVMRTDDADFPGMFCATNAGNSRRERTTAALADLYRAREWRPFFQLAIRERKTIGVCGATGAGKTALLRRLLADIPPSERIVTIEDTPEFGAAGPDNRVALFYGSSRAGLSAEQVVRASLRMRPDRIIMQEVRGGEAYAFIRALASGHSGATSWHAEADPWDALVLMVRQHEAGRALSDTDVIRILQQHIDIVVTVTRGDDGFRAPSVWLKGISSHEQAPSTK